MRITGSSENRVYTADKTFVSKKEAEKYSKITRSKIRKILKKSDKMYKLAKVIGIENDIGHYLVWTTDKSKFKQTTALKQFLELENECEKLELSLPLSYYDDADFFVKEIDLIGENL